QDSGVPPGVLRVPLTHGRVDAPVDRQPGGRPVVLYSPGLGGNRDSGTVLVEQLVSLGYVVATIDHPHDASEVEFPDGRVEVPAMPPLTPEVAARAVGYGSWTPASSSTSWPSSTPAATPTPSTGRFRRGCAAR